MNRERSYYLNRTLCDVLEELRTVIEKLQAFDEYNPHVDKRSHYLHLILLVEEAQSMANRMEAGLQDKKDLSAMNAEWHRMRGEIMELRKEKEQLLKDLGREDEDENEEDITKIIF